MRNEKAEMYREFTGWAPWVGILILVAVLGAVVPMVLREGDGSLMSMERVGPLLIMAGAGGLIWILFGGLLVTVHRDGIRVGLGRARILGTFISFDDVVDTEVVTYKPLREFGGWGLRGSRQKRAWTARGDRAVVLHTRDERRIYIGSDNPEKLESRIRSAMSMMPGRGAATAP